MDALNLEVARIRSLGISKEAGLAGLEDLCWRREAGSTYR